MCKASSAVIVVTLTMQLLVPLVRSIEHIWKMGKWEKMDGTYKDMGKS
jgi:hypothetical protein